MVKNKKTASNPLENKRSNDIATETDGVKSSEGKQIDGDKLEE
jgi:hypothetical protein